MPAVPEEWEAAKVKTHETLEQWSNSIWSKVSQYRFEDSRHKGAANEVLPNNEKEEERTLLSTFSKSVTANRYHRAILKDILIAANVTYNRCCWLYSTGRYERLYRDKETTRNVAGIRQHDLDTALFAKIASGAKPHPDKDLIYPGARRLFEEERRFKGLTAVRNTLFMISWGS